MKIYKIIAVFLGLLVGATFCGILVMAYQFFRGPLFETSPDSIGNLDRRPIPTTVVPIAQLATLPSATVTPTPQQTIYNSTEPSKTTNMSDLAERMN